MKKIRFRIDYLADDDYHIGLIRREYKEFTSYDECRSHAESQGISKAI